MLYQYTDTCITSCHVGLLLEQYSLEYWSKVPSRAIRSLRFIVTCTRIREQGCMWNLLPYYRGQKALNNLSEIKNIEESLSVKRTMKNFSEFKYLKNWHVFSSNLVLLFFTSVFQWKRPQFANIRWYDRYRQSANLALRCPELPDGGHLVRFWFNAIDCRVRLLFRFRKNRKKSGSQINWFK